MNDANPVQIAEQLDGGGEPRERTAADITK